MQKGPLEAALTQVVMETADFLLLLIFATLLGFLGLLAGVIGLHLYRQREFDKRLEQLALVFGQMGGVLLQHAMPPHMPPPTPFYRSDVRHRGRGVPEPPDLAPAQGVPVPSYPAPAQGVPVPSDPAPAQGVPPASDPAPASNTTDA